MSLQILFLVLLGTSYAVLAALPPPDGDGIMTLPLDSFPKDVVAHHFSCVESEQFATNCACHIKCRDPMCSNAQKICVKYKDKGCKYMLLRGQGIKKLATLKRVPMGNESAAYDISGFATNEMDLLDHPKYANYLERDQRGMKGRATTIADLIEGAGRKGEEVMNTLMKGGKAAEGSSYTSNTGGLNPGNAAGNRYCGDTNPRNEGWKKTFLEQGISLVTLSYRSPMSLVNSMRTYKKSGLLDMMFEKHAILSDPMPQEIAIALDHNFHITEPRDIPNAQMSRKNVLTIGAGFYYGLAKSKSEYVLFLENDFKMDVDLSKEDIQAQLVAAAGMLERGAEVVRLLSRKAKGCGTFKECGHAFRPADKEVGGKDRKRNWFSFYCPNHPGTEPYVDDCLDAAGGFRCFTSWDSNWSLNAIFVKKSTFMSKKYPTPDGPKTIPEIGLQNSKVNDGFERQMGFQYHWMNWKVPICISMQGMFIHHEIETGV